MTQDKRNYQDVIELPQLRFIRLPEVLAMTGISRSTLYLLIEKGAFPGQISLGARSVAWVESEVRDWMESRIKDRK